MKGNADLSKSLEQEELYEILEPPIKSEDIEIKVEPVPENDEDYNSMLSMEYLDTVQESTNAYDEEQIEEEYSFIDQKPKELKKLYKRCVSDIEVKFQFLIFN